MTHSESTLGELGQWAAGQNHPPNPPPQEGTPKNGGICSVLGCGRKAIARGWCAAHWLRWRRSPKGLEPERPIGDTNGANNSNWKGGVVYRPDGRVRVYSPNHPHAHKDGKYVLQYRLEKEHELGRYLDPKEVVHHPQGLSGTHTELLPSQSEHAKLHYNNSTKRFRGPGAP